MDKWKGKKGKREMWDSQVSSPSWGLLSRSSSAPPTWCAQQTQKKRKEMSFFNLARKHKTNTIDKFSSTEVTMSWNSASPVGPLGNLPYLATFAGTLMTQFLYGRPLVPHNRASHLRPPHMKKWANAQLVEQLTYIQLVEVLGTSTSFSPFLLLRPIYSLT